MLYNYLKICYNIYNETMENYNKYNQRLLNILSIYLNDFSNLIKKEEVEEIKKIGLDEEMAVKILFASYLGLDINDNEEDKELYHEYFDEMLKKDDENNYINNPYYHNISLTSSKFENWEIKKDKYEAYKMFVRDDMIKDFKGKIIPQIGYFNKDFYFDAIYQDDRLWMSISPNEINSMKKDIEDAFGNVVTLGLGMGYFAYMVSLKENVEKVIVVEKDINVIKLFKAQILPKFSKGVQDKITIINEDAYEYLKHLQDIDYVFVDIYHDVSDGKEVYNKISKIEKQYPNVIFRYWIAKTIKLYL